MDSFEGEYYLHNLCYDSYDSNEIKQGFQLILSKGLRINNKNIRNETPLHIVCSTSGDKDLIEYVIQLYINNELNIHERDNDGYRPLDDLCAVIRDINMVNYMLLNYAHEHLMGYLCKYLMRVLIKDVADRRRENPDEFILVNSENVRTILLFFHKEKAISNHDITSLIITFHGCITEEFLDELYTNGFSLSIDENNVGIYDVGIYKDILSWLKERDNNYDLFVENNVENN